MGAVQAAKALAAAMEAEGHLEAFRASRAASGLAERLADLASHIPPICTSHLEAVEGMVEGGDALVDKLCAAEPTVKAREGSVGGRQCGAEGANAEANRVFAHWYLPRLSSSALTSLAFNSLFCRRRSRWPPRTQMASRLWLRGRVANLRPRAGCARRARPGWAAKSLPRRRLNLNHPLKNPPCFDSRPFDSICPHNIRSRAGRIFPRSTPQ